MLLQLQFSQQFLILSRPMRAKDENKSQKRRSMLEWGCQVKLFPVRPARPPKLSGVLQRLLLSSSPASFCLRHPRNCRAAQTPFENCRADGSSLHDNTRGPSSHPIPPSHHVLATGIAALRAVGGSPARPRGPGPHLRRPCRDRESQASRRPLRPRRHLCHCSGTASPPTPADPSTSPRPPNCLSFGTPVEDTRGEGLLP